MNLERPVICLVTEGNLVRGDVAGAVRVLETIERAAGAGIDLIQIRERALDARSLVAFAHDAIRSVARTRTRILINDRVDVAIAAGAAGVHLRGDSVAAPDVRRIAPPDFLVGRSVHSEAEAAEAAAQGGCDYLIFGTVFPSTGKRDRQVVGVDALRRVCARVDLPVLAIGGVSLQHAPAIASAGAAGLAAISLFARSAASSEDVARLRRAFDT